MRILLMLQTSAEELGDKMAEALHNAVVQQIIVAIDAILESLP